MPYSATAFNVLIASPGDVASERALIRETLAEWNVIHAEARKLVLLPVGWETHTSPTMGERPQAVINKQILKDCDLLVGVFWTRIGTRTDEHASGTVEEIEEHIKAGKPTMLYFSAAPVALDSVDPTQYTALKEFRDSCKSRGLFETYADINDFKTKFFRQLQLKLNKEEYFTDHSTAVTNIEPAFSSRPDIPTLSREAQTLLKEAAQDQHGVIMSIASMGGRVIQTNGKGFVEPGNPRSSATWEGAVDELERLALIVARGYERRIFNVTREGFAVAELLKP